MKYAIEKGSDRETRMNWPKLCSVPIDGSLGCDTWDPLCTGYKQSINQKEKLALIF